MVTGDPLAWIVYNNVSQKRWSKRGEAAQTVAKAGLHPKKVMLSIWWDWKGIVYYELLLPNKTIDSTKYCSQLAKLKRTIDQKWPELANRKGVVFHQDNARLHVSLMTWITNILLCVIWFCGIAVAAPLAYFRNYYERQWKDYLETYCTEDTALVYPYWHIFVGLSVWGPLTIMVVCYSAILVKLDRYETQTLKSEQSIVVRYKGRVAQILALMVLAFIVCRVPFTVLIIRRVQLLQASVKAGRAESIYVLWYISRYLVLVNAAINPLLYGCSSTRLRRELVICPAISWLICQRKWKLQMCSVSQCKLQQCSFYLKSHSPCIDMNDRVISNISSGITTNNSN
ncbi:2-oxoglutarate receptor 1-like [Odontomachus brunneus]|uniref:2-oxoglutarate receptor 1-like n=1 Tax=Odontomachus brunneus TaxID=486640 RepID=UPI0013F24FB1|nr:2-oxoglutarate receptor 1-like [Odontomachus brunneus]